MHSSTRLFPVRGPFLGVALVSLTLGVAMVAGCGGSEIGFTPVEGTESAYCNTFRAWQVHELDGEGDDQPNPAAFEKYWNDYLEFNATSLEQAPLVILDEWALSERTIRTVLTPILERYDFDVERIAREGAPADQALTEPPADVQKAQAAIHAYEARVCGVDPPPAADVVFGDDGTSGRSARHCARSTAGSRRSSLRGSTRWSCGRSSPRTASRRLSKRWMPRLPPRSPLTSKPKPSGSAPVGATSSPSSTSTSAASGWTAPPRIRAVFTLSHPDVAEHDSRLTAYEEQRCTG